MPEENKKYPGKIRTKIILASLIPLCLVVLILEAVTYRIAVYNLDREFGKRLVAIANLTAAQLNALKLRSLSPGDESSRIYQNLLAQLNQIKNLEEISVIAVFDRNNKVLLDTEDTAIGAQYYRFYLDRDEIEAAAKEGGAASVTFTGSDGLIYKSGYGPVYDGGELVALVGVQGSPGFYGSLRILQLALLVTAVVGILLVIVLSMFIAGRLVRPILRLASIAEQIGRGEVDKEVTASSNDELGLLADSINEMRLHLIERDLRMQMMLQGIAHEIKNPLGGMKLFADLLRSEVQGDKNLLTYMDKIDGEINTLGRIINEFMDFSKDAVVEKRRGDLRKCIEEVVESVTTRFEKKEISLVRQLPAEIKMDFDWDKLRRVFHNLLENSFQAVKDRGGISIQAGKEGGYWSVTITDDGPGIEPANLEKIFEPFFSTKERGSGLGLAFVKKIVEGHGGTIRVSSEVQKGAAFELRLPEK
jgi:signal transduction histidine kinase